MYLYSPHAHKLFTELLGRSKGVFGLLWILPEGVTFERRSVDACLLAFLVWLRVPAAWRRRFCFCPWRWAKGKESICWERLHGGRLQRFGERVGRLVCM